MSFLGLSIEWLLFFLSLGTFIGFMAGLLGIGGGGIMVPILTSFFIYLKLPPERVVHLALGTSMGSIVLTSLASLLAHHKNHNVLWPVVKKMFLGIMLGAFLATFIVEKVSSINLALFFSFFMAYIAFKMFNSKVVKETTQRSQRLIGKVGLFFAASCIGTISSLVSIGGGSLTVPFLHWQNIDLKKSIGTSAALGLPISLAGSLGYILNGNFSTEIDSIVNNSIIYDYTLGFIYLPAVLLISVTSFISAPYGANLANKLPIARLKKIFAILLLLLSIKMLILVLS